MRNLNRWARVALVLSLLGTGVAFAQGSGTLQGNVVSSDGSPLPGVLVTVTSPALIGERTTSSGENGDYIIRGFRRASTRCCSRSRA